MATINFTKETKGISITKNGVKISMSQRVVFMGFPTGASTANINIAPFVDRKISQFVVDTTTDTLSINAGATFVGTASAFIDSLRTNVFIADV